MSIEEKLFECWLGGVGLKEAAIAVERVLGVRPEREEVRRHYLVFSRPARSGVVG